MSNIDFLVLDPEKLPDDPAASDGPKMVLHSALSRHGLDAARAAKRQQSGGPTLMWRVVVAAALFVLCACVHAQGFSGRVVRVIDGDTIVVLVDRQQVHVRLAQIDAPEHNQAWGTRSKQQLAALVARSDVTVVSVGLDRYGRTIGEVFVGRDDVNRDMVAAGMAWAYRRYLTDRSLLVLEQQARSARRGLWADPGPVPPWEWRRARKMRRTAPR